MRRLLFILILIAGCAGQSKVAKTEQKLAKKIGSQGTVEGMFYTIDGVPTVRTTWGLVPLQPAQPITIPMATYVQASGIVTRGKLVDGKFVPSHADFRGIRPQHDMVLRQAKVERHDPPGFAADHIPIGDAVKVSVNGDEKELPDASSATALLAMLKLTPDKVAIELNRRLLRSDKYDAPLKDGDVLEVVTFVGGG